MSSAEMHTAREKRREEPEFVVDGEGGKKGMESVVFELGQNGQFVLQKRGAA